MTSTLAGCILGALEFRVFLTIVTPGTPRHSAFWPSLLQGSGVLDILGNIMVDLSRMPGALTFSYLSIFAALLSSSVVVGSCWLGSLFDAGDYRRGGAIHAVKKMRASADKV